MKKFLALISILLLPCFFGYAADTKISALTADTSPTADDLVATVNDPAGTPASRKVTVADLGKGLTQHWIIPASDETTALTTGTGKMTWNAPCAMTVTAVRASVITAPTGSVATWDINEAGTTILSTKLTIDATEKTSTTAATAAVISDTTIADDAILSIDQDGVGSTIAGVGAKIIIYGRCTA